MASKDNTENRYIFRYNTPQIDFRSILIDIKLLSTYLSSCYPKVALLIRSLLLFFEKQRLIKNSNIFSFVAIIVKI